MRLHVIIAIAAMTVFAVSIITYFLYASPPTALANPAKQSTPEREYPTSGGQQMRPRF